MGIIIHHSSWRIIVLFERRYHTRISMNTMALRRRDRKRAHTPRPQTTFTRFETRMVSNRNGITIIQTSETQRSIGIGSDVDTFSRRLLYYGSIRTSEIFLL